MLIIVLAGFFIYITRQRRSSFGLVKEAEINRPASVPESTPPADNTGAKATEDKPAAEAKPELPAVRPVEKKAAEPAQLSAAEKKKAEKERKAAEKAEAAKKQHEQDLKAEKEQKAKALAEEKQAAKPDKEKDGKTKSAKEKEAAESHAAETPYTGSTQVYDYAAKDGDNLADLAARFGVPVADLKRDNSLTGESLKAKQKLKVKVRALHLVEKGDALIKIAKKYGLKPAQIRRANNLKNDNIQLGKKVVIPLN